MSPITAMPTTTAPTTTAPGPTTTAPTKTAAPVPTTTPPPASNQVSYVDVAGLMSILHNYLVSSPLVNDTHGDQIDTSAELNNINQNLHQISASLSDNNSGNVLAQQNGVDSIVNNEMNRLHEKKQIIDGALTTQQRMMQMNDTYTKRQHQYTKMLVAIAVAITLMIVMSYIAFAFPEWSALATVANIVIIVIIFIYCFWTYYYMAARDPIYYDQLNIQQDPFPVTNNGAAATPAPGAHALTTDGQCIGPSCCNTARGAVWDASNNVCIKESFFVQPSTKTGASPYEPSEMTDYTKY
jgi:hypothetical protein